MRYFEASGDAPRIAQQAASISLALDDPARTITYIDAALATLATLGDTPWAARAATNVLWLQSVLTKDQADLPGAERRLREVIARQRTLAAASGEEQPYSCLPLLTLGSVEHCQGSLATALAHYQRSLDHAWRFQEPSCSAVTLARIAGMVATAGRWQEAAWLFGATEAFCDTNGLTFAAAPWTLARAFGLPQPWQGAVDFTRQAAEMWAATQRRSPAPLPPLPDPAAAAERALAERARLTATLRRRGVEVVDAPPDIFASVVADAYLALKAEGRL